MSPMVAAAAGTKLPVLPKGDKRGLTHEGGFTAHVGAGDDVLPRINIKPRVIGHERIGGHRLNHQVSSSVNHQFWTVAKRRPH